VAGDSEGEVVTINDFGAIAGYSGNCLSVSLHARLWKDGKLINLGSLGGVLGSEATSINSLSEITGTSDLAGD
jgi:probable HAF family extracellular repeat protein